MSNTTSEQKAQKIMLYIEENIFDKQGQLLEDIVISHPNSKDNLYIYSDGRILNYNDKLYLCFRELKKRCQSGEKCQFNHDKFTNFKALEKINQKDFDHALYCASHAGQIEAIALLKSYGADDFNEALCCASFAGQIEAIELLKSYGADDFNRALCCASYGGQIEAIELLKSYGADDFNEALCCARYGGYIVAIELLKSYGALKEASRIRKNKAVVSPKSDILDRIHHWFRKD